MADDAWMELMVANPVMRSFLASCTPGYYNNEGGELSALSSAATRTARPPFRYIEQWRARGEFAGLEFRRSPSKRIRT